MYREQGLVRVDHELHHADDSSAVLHSCRALHAELLLWALLLVQQVRPEYGGQVQRRHLITNHLQYSINNTNTAIISNCIDLSELVGLWWSWKTTHDLQNLPYRDFYCAFKCFCPFCSLTDVISMMFYGKDHERKKGFLFHLIKMY